MHFSFKNLRKPTPKKWRRIGNALVAVSTSVALPTAIMGSMAIGIVVFSIGAIGKFIAEMTKENDDHHGRDNDAGDNQEPDADDNEEH